MRPLFTVVTLHLRSGEQVADERMALESVGDKELSFISKERLVDDIKDIEFATISMIYGNSARLLFSVHIKDIEQFDDKQFKYLFFAPTPKVVKIGDENRIVECVAYEKLRSMIKARTGKSKVYSDEEDCSDEEICLRGEDQST